MRNGFRCILLLMAIASPLLAQREPVLKQIDLPHPYYYREMYLPQLTSGQSAVTWSPDSKQVIFSMQGSLWRQSIDSRAAQQLTAAPGYDYEPDWSPDGNNVVFSRYDHDAVELYSLELATGKVEPLTNGGAVNVEARWSPDGKRIAFVSTSNTKHFHIFIADFQSGQVRDIVQLTQEHRSDLPRYYYSQFDHEISPAWSPDSSEIIFVSNRGHIHGTGGFWRMKAEPGATAKEIRYEETTWKAHPDWSPEGKRIVYSSYLGRPWHQLWIMTADGGDPFPLTYGDFDITAARWSPDGQKIAFISNKDGNTSLWIQEVIGGHQTKLEPMERQTLHAMAHLNLLILDSQGRTTSARVSITGEDGRTYAPDDAWIHADDSFDRSERPFEAHYFHSSGRSEIMVPPGEITVEVLKGFEHKFERNELHMKPDEIRSVVVRLKPLNLPVDWKGWISSDLHVHMNYCGAYRNTPEHLVSQAAAEDLNIVNNLIVNKEQRIPDISYFSAKPDPASTPNTLLLHSQEFHTGYWGHLGLLGLKQNFLIPGYAAYPNTPAASLYPTNAVIADMAHRQGALVGYVHPFDAESEPDPWTGERLTERELPVDVALGKVDYYEVIGFTHHKTAAAVWYRLLNCGFKLPAGAGTDAMANFASLRGPLGMNRVYVHGDRAHWMDALRSGRTFATNGPLIGFSVNGRPVGSELKLPSGKQDLRYSVWLRSIVPVDHLQIVFNGEVIREIELHGDHTSVNASGTVSVEGSGWLVLRAWCEKAVYPVLDIYPYASTSPIYVMIGGASRKSAKDAAYFLAWIDRVIEEVKAHSGYNTEAEKEETLKELLEARKIYEQQR